MAKQITSPSLGVTDSRYLQIANNLSDLNSSSTARTNLGVAIGSDVQAWDADLDTISALSSADSNFIVGSASGWVVESGATVRTTLGLGSIALLNSIDISSNTNLAVTSPITLTGDSVGLNQSALDHGSIGGLTDDDHTQYILVDGTRAFTGNQSFGDNNITNVGDISLDTISADATSISVTLANSAGADLLIGNNNTLVVEGDNDRMGIGTAAPSSKLHILGTTNEMQLILQAHSTQAMNMFEQQTSTGAVQILFNSDGGAVFNEEGNDADFRVEGVNDANTLVINAENDRVGIGIGAPDTKLEIVATTTQLRLTHTDTTNEADIKVDTNGILSFTPTGTSVSFSDKNITNVGNIKLDSLTSDATDITITPAGDTLFANNTGVVIGHTAKITAFTDAELQVLGTGLRDSAMVFGRWVAGVAGPAFVFTKSRSGTIGSNAIVQDNDNIGRIMWTPDDGVDYSTQAAVFLAEVDDASPAAGDIGMAFVWNQMPGGGGAIAETMRLSAAGRLGVGATTPLATIHADQDSTSAAIPALIVDQADISEGTINFIASARGTGSTAATDIADSVRVEINGTVMRLALYTDA